MKEQKHTNHLINETSPYLLQHAHNPVEWFSWSEAAFEKAHNEDKPILLSIGYSACHWCHVMEGESFENEKIARIMNENFVNIKVDLEERPDIDQIYMTFVQITSGHGGYPLNVFLTPDKKPFFGGTYFPPEPRHNMPSFPQILQSIKEAWNEKREDIVHSADEVLDEIQRVNQIETAGENLSESLLDLAFQKFVASFDKTNGGFGGAPKFPPQMSLEFLIRYFKRTNNQTALEIVRKTLDKMAHGGIYDQLGGGFHRYTVDAIWLVPHFEKMLYDNAQLARIYAHFYQITKNDFYKRIATETLDYIKREMLDPKGGFYSAQDADSEGIEGKFFVWKPKEIEEILGAEDAKIFNFYFDISDAGNFEGENILNIKNTVEETAQAFEMSEKKVSEILENGRRTVFQKRESRIKPFRDEKVLTAWNGLMLAAFAEASAIFQKDEYLEIAKNNADFILENLRENKYLLRTWKDGKGKLNSYIEDYANFADGLIELFQVSGEAKYLKEAKNIADKMIAEFWDEEQGGFFFTGENHEKLLVRSKDFYDNATPSGNSVAADVLLKLSHLLGDEKYARIAADVLRLVSAQIKRYPQAFGRALSVLSFYFASVKEIVIIGERENQLEREVWEEYLPNKIVVVTEIAGENAELIPLLENRDKIEGKPTAYVCENFTCQKPVTAVDELKKQLS